MKRTLSLLLCIMLLVSVFSVAFAEASPRASEVIAETTITTRFANGKLYVAGEVVTADTADKLGIVSMIIYEKVDGSWVARKSVTGKYGYNDTDYLYSTSITGSNDKEYKITAIFYGKIGDLTDRFTQTSYAP